MERFLISAMNIAVENPPPPKGPAINLRINNLESPTISLRAPAEYIVFGM